MKSLLVSGGFLDFATLHPLELLLLALLAALIARVLLRICGFGRRPREGRGPRRAA